MNVAEAVSSQDRQVPRPVFVSFATSDRKQASAVCEAIESRGMPCWISSRDVAPGENYQEAIVEAIRVAPAMVLVFSKHANDSDEIKKELSLASRCKVPVLVLRIAQVEPSGAFAYELSTRQWIDAFKSWDRAIDLVVDRIGQIAGATPSRSPQKASGPRRSPLSSRRKLVIAAAAVLLVLLAAGSWWSLRPSPAPAHPMSVRLAGFQPLSADLPATLRSAVDAEIAAAFNADGVVGVSTAPAPAPGTAPAYALGGTVQRQGSAIRVITRLTNERSGATLWSDTFEYDGKEAGSVPRHIAVDAGNVVRCGLFGASTYRKALPDPVLKDYFQFCEGHWDLNMRDGRKALVPAQRVVAAVPDFSWGWAAVAGGYWKVAMSLDGPAVEEARAKGRQAADRAVALDSQNSEALWIKSMLVDSHDWIGRETLLKRAVAARRLDCGCEHHQYGGLLLNVGRVAESVEQMRQGNDMLALYVYTAMSLAESLVAAGDRIEARHHYQAALALAPSDQFAGYIRAAQAAATGDLALLADPTVELPAGLRAALLRGWRAVDSADRGAKLRAAQALVALPEEDKDAAVAHLLGELGADREAFELAARLAEGKYGGPSVFFHRGMRGALNDPRFPAMAAKLGLFAYWKASRTRPDVCKAAPQPRFCQMI